MEKEMPEASLKRLENRMPWGGGSWLHKLASVFFSSDDLSLRMLWLQVIENNDSNWLKQ